MQGKFLKLKSKGHFLSYTFTGKNIVSHVVQSGDAGSEFLGELTDTKERKYVMVSGKGGVGKTSLSSSLAIQFATAGHVTLLVSTDPAHSLSDSLDQDVSGGSPVQVQGVDYPLWALEIDPEVEKDKFKTYASTSGKKDFEDVAGGFGIKGILEQLADVKLGELLDSPPPGFDEAVAIAKVQQFVSKDEFAKFSRIIFDTAPTGHTLRLLTVPDFVDAALSKIINLRTTLSTASKPIRALFNTTEEPELDKLMELQKNIRQVRDLFRDQKSTEFVIATIPTVLAINESARLIKALRKEQIPCHRIVVNQIIEEDTGKTFLNLKLKEQERATDLIQHDPNLSDLTTIKSPYLDLEVRGVPALQYLGSQVWQNVIKEFAESKDRKYFMLGGKGGVGKTSCSASLGVALGNSGHKTLVVSTDPAHSLSDSLDQFVGGGEPVEISDTNGKVWGLEIDIEAAKQDLRNLGKGGDGREIDDILDSIGLGAITDQLKSLKLGEILDTPPPGIDEAAAIAKVIQILKKKEFEDFDRIVFDTAPTGHTLRLLSLPDFLDTSIGKILQIRQRISSFADSIKGIFTGNAVEDESTKKFENFRAAMMEAKEIFRDKKSSQFIVVCIPTIMAISESSRLVNSLRKEGVPVNYVVLNQVLDSSTTDIFFKNRYKDQQRALDLLRHDENLSGLRILQAPILDLELRGVPALKYFGDKVWK